jgi:hypothetical protein
MIRVARNTCGCDRLFFGQTENIFLNKELSMSQTKLRQLAGEVLTLREIGTLLNVNVSRAWSWQRGADIFTAQDVAILEAHVLQRVYKITALAVM